MNEGNHDHLKSSWGKAGDYFSYIVVVGHGVADKEKKKTLSLKCPSQGFNCVKCEWLMDALDSANDHCELQHVPVEVFILFED